MPRIRSIKPEFWTSAQVLECSRNARLLFVGLWNFCDDAGRHPMAPKQCKAEVFPSDEISSEDILGMLSELSKNGLIRTYAVDGIDYFYVTGWHHQRIDKPQDPRYPAPTNDNSTNVLGTLPPDRKGEDRKGREISSSLRSDVARSRARTPKDELAEVLDEEHAAAVVDHRRKLRKPLTPHAAKLLAGQFRHCENPNAAADAMIVHGWQGFKPGWLENLDRGHRGNGKLAPHDKLMAAVAEVFMQPDEPEQLTIDVDKS